MKLHLETMRSELPPVFAVADGKSWLFERGYSAPLKALAELERRGELIRLRRGLYGFAEGFDRLAAAAVLHPPAYVSFETALGYYGLIPERVEAVLSVVDGRPATYDTPVGRYVFHAQSRDLYAMGMTMAFSEWLPVPMASREKALLDTLMRARLVAARMSAQGVLAFVCDGLRIDESSLRKLSLTKMRRMAPLYRNHAPRRFVAAVGGLPRGKHR